MPIHCGYYLEVMYKKVLTKKEFDYKRDESFVRRKYYVIKNHPKTKNMTVGDFLDKWNSSSEYEKGVLRDGLGYCI